MCQPGSANFIFYRIPFFDLKTKSLSKARRIYVYHFHLKLSTFLSKPYLLFIELNIFKIKMSIFRVKLETLRKSFSFERLPN